MHLFACTTAPTGRTVPVEDRGLTAEDIPQKPVSYEQEEIREEPRKKLFSDSPVEQQSTPVVVALLEDADQLSKQGRHDQAAASLERALRIEPKDPILWQRLGALRLQQRKWPQAMAMAQKSNTLSRGNPKIQSYNWKIIAAAKRAIGDKAGAAEAEKMIRILEK